MTARADLIAELEKATGPSLDLDHAIASVVRPDDGHGVPLYTASLDAAMTLTGKHAVAVLLEAIAMAARYFIAFSDDGDHIKNHLPRFVCIAALKAGEA